MTMAAPSLVEDEEEFFSADEAANTPPPPRETGESERGISQTPLPHDVMEELASITSKLYKFKDKKNPEIEDTLQLFVQEWRHQTKEEIEELVVLKERVAVRKAQRAEEEERMAEMRREEEEFRLQMIEEEKIRKQEDKLKRLQVAELKRQKMMEEQSKGRNFKIATTTKEPSSDPQDLTRELTKEEYDVMKEAALSVIIKPLEIGGLRKERLKRRAQELWDKVVKLETERYDLEDRRTRQEYDYKELKERQKQQLRQKALKLGLAPEALTGRYPPKIRVASKYEKRTGLLPFGETKGLFEGGFLEESNRKIDDAWYDRQEVFTKRHSDELPSWLADMPRQILKQIEEEEAAARAEKLKEEEEARIRAEEQAREEAEREAAEREAAEREAREAEEREAAEREAAEREAREAEEREAAAQAEEEAEEGGEEEEAEEEAEEEEGEKEAAPESEEKEEEEAAEEEAEEDEVASTAATEEVEEEEVEEESSPAQKEEEVEEEAEEEAVVPQEEEAEEEEEEEG